MLKKILAVVMFGMVALAGTQARAETPATKAFAEMKQMLGTVPTFLKELPEDVVADAWEMLKGVELNPKSAIPGQYKELIGLGVAAQIPCRYCTYFHKQAAQLMGATDKQVKEALLVAAQTRQWSTVLNGVQTDEASFRAEVAKILTYLKSPHGASSIQVTDAASAYKDIEATLGSVPSFLRAFPEAGIASAWRQMKTVQLNPNSAIPGKYGQLVGLAVASQIPCRYCIYFHTEAAKLMGATDAEIREAIAVAALTRHFSTWLNGMQFDEAQFRRETDDIIGFVRKHVAAR
jgi:AhpD family alkylhydroperoxidase